MREFLELYRELHASPELSNQEEKTAARIAALWRATGAEVTERVGGWGVVAKVKNGDGPCLMLRTDMDALPVSEETGLAYASKVKVTGEDGKPTGVMHACGHDMHMTCVTGALKYLTEHSKKWRGTLIVVGQGAEERGTGARAMLNDKLWERFGKPDMAVALHVGADIAAGEFGITDGFAMANVDSVDITIEGRGGHGAYPHTAIDPIVTAARLVLDLQTIVSREINPQDPAVITVGSISGGSKHNVIPDRCHLQVTVRSYSEEVRIQLKQAVERKAKAAADSAGAPAPKIVFSEGTDALYNDIPLSSAVRKVLIETFGADKMAPRRPSMGGEDFSAYGRSGVPICMFWLGAVPQEQMARAKHLKIPPPPLHSPLFYPDAEPCLQMGVTALSKLGIELLSPEKPYRPKTNE